MSKFKSKSSEKAYLEVLRLKQHSKCIDCNMPSSKVSLTFDHMPEFEKKFDISSSWTRRSGPAIMVEIAKCQLVCRRCHDWREAARCSVKGIEVGNIPHRRILGKAIYFLSVLSGSNEPYYYEGI